MLGLFDVDPSLRMQVAVGTSLATIIPTSIISARSHWGRGGVDRALLCRLGPMTLIGVLAGTWGASRVSGPALVAVFAGVGFLVAIKMARGPDAFIIAPSLPGRSGTALIGAMIGGVSAMMGIGGGTLTVPVLSLFRYPIHLAVGTSAALGLVISLVGAVGFVVIGWGNPRVPPFSFGYVNLAGFLAIAPSAMLAAPWGARAAHALSRDVLSRAFAFFLFLTSIKLAYGLLLAGFSTGSGN